MITIAKHDTQTPNQTINGRASGFSRTSNANQASVFKLLVELVSCLNTYRHLHVNM